MTGMMDRAELGGRVALVTGASAGLGRHFAKVIARAGASVAVAGRRTEKLEELASEIESDGGTVFPVRIDVADSASILHGLAAIETKFGSVDLLINNAGIPDAALATKLPLEMIDTIISTNVKAPFILSREVASRLIKQGKPGRIVNISSISAYHYARAGASLYSVTKAALSRMTEVLAVEWAGRNINVNAIAPGTFASEMTDGMIERIGDDFVKSYPRKRLGQPEQLESTLLYLLSPASEAVTGVVITVDDGQFPR